MQNNASALSDDLAPGAAICNLDERVEDPRFERHASRLKDYVPVKASHPRGIKRILVCTDFSSVSAKAIERAVAMANQCEAVLMVLHVVDINAEPTPTESEVAEPFIKRLWAEDSEQMEQLADSLTGEAKVEMMLKLGLPWEEIVRQSQDADLVIMGKARGKNGWKFFSKQTCERVIKNAVCPVMVVSEQS